MDQAAIIGAAPWRQVKTMPRPIKNVLVFHAKLNGDIRGHTFSDGETFFATSSNAAEMYAEHLVFNGDDAAGDENDSSIETAGITIFPVLLTIKTPAFLDRMFLRKIALSVGIAPDKVARFIDDTEDSCPNERSIVFSWLRKQGYDGAVFPNDLMPLVACGDWVLRESLVAFHPETQVQFALSTSHVPWKWSSEQDRSMSDMANMSIDVPVRSAMVCS